MATAAFAFAPSAVALAAPDARQLNTLKAATSFRKVQSVRRLVHCVAEDASKSPPPAPEPTPKATVESPKKPTFSMKKGQIVRVDKEKYLNSIEYYAVGHPKFYKGLDYIYEDRGEVLDIRNFEAGEYALITWAGIPGAPAWLPTYMLIKIRIVEEDKYILWKLH